MGLVLIHHCSANISAGWVVGARLWDGGTLVPTKEDTVGDLTSMSRGQDFCNKWEPRGRNGADGSRYSPSSHEGTPLQEVPGMGLVVILSLSSAISPEFGRGDMVEAVSMSGPGLHVRQESRCLR